MVYCTCRSIPMPMHQSRSSSHTACGTSVHTCLHIVWQAWQTHRSCSWSNQHPQSPVCRSMCHCCKCHDWSSLWDKRAHCSHQIPSRYRTCKHLRRTPHCHCRHFCMQPCCNLGLSKMSCICRYHCGIRHDCCTCGRTALSGTHGIRRQGHTTFLSTCKCHCCTHHGVYCSQLGTCAHCKRGH